MKYLLGILLGVILFTILAIDCIIRGIWTLKFSMNQSKNKLSKHKWYNYLVKIIENNLLN